MRKLALLTLLLVLAVVGVQAQGIVKSLERNVPGQGKVTIHQDPRIEALIGMERPATGEQKVIKTSGCVQFPGGSRLLATPESMSRRIPRNQGS
jgi:hypothetical protein